MRIEFCVISNPEMATPPALAALPGAYRISATSKSCDALLAGPTVALDRVQRRDLLGEAEDLVWRVNEYEVDLIDAEQLEAALDR